MMKMIKSCEASEVGGEVVEVGAWLELTNSEGLPHNTEGESSHVLCNSTLLFTGFLKEINMHLLNDTALCKHQTIYKLQQNYRT